MVTGLGGNVFFQLQCVDQVEQESSQLSFKTYLFTLERKVRKKQKEALLRVLNHKVPWPFGKSWMAVLGALLSKDQKEWSLEITT